MSIMRLSVFSLAAVVFAASVCPVLARERKEKEQPPTASETAASPAETKPEPPATEVALPPGPKIAVVDVTAIFDNYNRKKDEDVNLEKIRSQIQKQIDEKEAELQNLEKELEILEGDEKLKKKAEFDDKKDGFRAFYRLNDKDLKDRQCELWKNIYTEILDEVKRLAEKEGYDIVLKVDDNQVKGSNLEQVLIRVDMMKVLYHSGQMDLTDTILNVLNEKYKSAKESKEKS